eukprot:sb/3475996/
MFASPNPVHLDTNYKVPRSPETKYPHSPRYKLSPPLGDDIMTSPNMFASPNPIPPETEYESNWRPKCKDEEKKTPQLYERNRQLRLELQMLYKQADTVISHAQAMKATDDRKGMAFPSIKV